MLKSGHLVVLILIQFSKILLISKTKIQRRKKYRQRRERNCVLKIYLNFPKKENKISLRNEGGWQEGKNTTVSRSRNCPQGGRVQKILETEFFETGDTSQHNLKESLLYYRKKSHETLPSSHLHISHFPKHLLHGPNNIIQRK